MTRKNHNKIKAVVHPICCGLDVHKKMVSASIIITEPDGEQTVIRLRRRPRACPWMNAKKIS